MSSTAVPKTTPYDPAVAEVHAKLEELKTTLATLLRLQAEYGGSPAIAPSNRGGDSEISHDSFFNMTIGDAAKKYLGMVKVTKSTADIAQALEQGGLKHSSKDFPTTVRSILGPREDFTRVPNGDWGLTEWYGRKKLKAEKSKRRKQKRKPRSPETAQKEAAQSIPEPPAPPIGTPIGTQIRIKNYLAVHPDASAQEISEKLSLKIQTVSLILGKLKKKAAA